MGKKAGTKGPATKLDKAIAEARSEVERRTKQLADANRALAQLEARRPASEAVAPKPAVVAPAAPQAAAAKVPAKAAAPVRKPAARKPAAAKPVATPRRSARTSRPASRSGKTP